MPLVSRIIEVPKLRREAARHTQSGQGIISESRKAREPRCRRRVWLLGYARHALSRKLAGNPGVFAKPRDGHGAFTQTLRALRIADGLEARRRLLRVHASDGVEDGPSVG